MNLSTVGAVRKSDAPLWSSIVARCGVVLTASLIGACPAIAAEPGAAADASEAASSDAGASATPHTPSSAERGRALDAKYGYKGWNVQFPSYGDSLVNDDDNWRTDLAAHGFGFSVQGSAIFQNNLLDTPGRIPQTGYAPCAQNNLDYGCAGGRSYFGQRPSIMAANSAFLTYDLSQYGIPDGQFAIGSNFGGSTDQQYTPNTFRFNGFSYYQTLFDKKLEFKIGYFALMPEFAGTFVGGLVVNPFGPTASVPIILGMSPNSISTPAVKLKWNVTDALYGQVAVQRSLPIHGPTGNSIYDEVESNPSGMKFRSTVPGTRELYITEAGYKKPSAPDTPFVWLRAGYLKNTSTFSDYSKMLQDPQATKKGSHGFYALGDYQVTQTAPSSPYTAYRGLYLGASYMYGDPKSASFTQYFEARAYLVGPTATRTSDMLSFVYSRNKVSKYLEEGLVAFAPYTNFEPIKQSNSLTMAYTYHVRSGLYATAGLGYTDKPSLTKFSGEGSSLNALLSLYWIF